MKFSIIGLGLMGISLAKAIKNNFPNSYISASDIDQDILNICIKHNIIDNFSDIRENIENSDFIILSTPINIVKLILKNYHFNQDKVIIDICSTKLFTEEFNDIINFIPCHPMCGNIPIRKNYLQYDINNINVNIFLNNNVFIINDNKKDQKKFEIVVDFWNKIGANIFKNISYLEHDKICSITSHLIHFISFSLIEVLPDDFKINNHNFKDFFRCMSKIINYELWIYIFSENKINITNYLDIFIKYILNHQIECLEENFDDLFILTSKSILRIINDENYISFGAQGMNNFISISNNKFNKINKNLIERFKTILIKNVQNIDHDDFVKKLEECKLKFIKFNNYEKNNYI